MRLLTAGSLVRVQLGEPYHERSRTLADEIILVGEGFGFVVFL